MEAATAGQQFVLEGHANVAVGEPNLVNDGLAYAVPLMLVGATHHATWGIDPEDLHDLVAMVP